MIMRNVTGVMNPATRRIWLAAVLCLTVLSSPLRANASEIDSLDIKIGQMLMVGFRGITAPDISPIGKHIRDLHLGGVVLFDFDVEKKEYGRNIVSPAQVQKLTGELQERSRIPLFIAIDQEGGLVCRLKTRAGFPPNVSPRQLGRLNSLDSTRMYTDLIARSLRILGVNVNFAPVVDVDINPDNPVIGKLGRSISSDPKTVSRHARTIIESLHARSVLSALKHFPGHGSSKADSHLGFVDVSSTWSRRELIPYIDLIGENLPDMIMTAHIYNSKLDQTRPATLSRDIIDGLLRKELGYDGVVISDDMMMKAIADHYGLEQAIKNAVNAGVDILLFANNTYTFDPAMPEKAFSILKRLVEKGEIPMARIEKSYGRIMKLKQTMD